MEDEQGNEATVVWTPETPGIVEIDGTNFKAVGKGVCNITAKVGSTTYTVIIRVY